LGECQEKETPTFRIKEMEKRTALWYYGQAADYEILQVRHKNRDRRGRIVVYSTALEMRRPARDRGFAQRLIHHRRQHFLSRDRLI